MFSQPSNSTQPEQSPVDSKPPAIVHPPVTPHPMHDENEPQTIRMPQRDSILTADSAELLQTYLDGAQQFHTRLADALSEYGLSEIRYHVMQAISESRATGCSQRSLAAKFGQAESSISTLVQRMCQDGLLSQQQSPMDRRRRFLVLTDTGRELIGDAHTRYEQEVVALLQPLSPEQRSALRTILSSLAPEIAMKRAA